MYSVSPNQRSLEMQRAPIPGRMKFLSAVPVTSFLSKASACWVITCINVQPNLGVNTIFVDCSNRRDVLREMVDCQARSSGGTPKTTWQTRSPQHAVFGNDITRRGQRQSKQSCQPPPIHLQQRLPTNLTQWCIQAFDARQWLTKRCRWTQQNALLTKAHLRHVGAAESKH